MPPLTPPPQSRILNKVPRGGAVVARWAHNPKVGGSNPSPAIEGAGENRPFFFAFRVLAFQNRSAQVLVCGVVPAAQALFPQPKGQRLESARTDGERSPCKCP